MKLEPYTMMGLVLFGVMVLGFGLIFTLPAALQIEKTYSGEVTSTTNVDFITPTTCINFKDGSYFNLWGTYHVPVGNHTFVVKSSWFNVNNLISLDGGNQ